MSQDRPLVEVYARQPDGRWLLSATEGLEDEVVFGSLGARVAMAEIYGKVDLDSDAAPDQGAP